MKKANRIAIPALLCFVFSSAPFASVKGADISHEAVEDAIKLGVRYLKAAQQPDGSWRDVESDAMTGTTSLMTLALLTAGERPDSPTISRALDYLRKYSPEQLKSTYAVSLQLMVYAAATPEQDQVKIAAGVAWLERAQIRAGDKVSWPGSWSYSEFKNLPGDNSNSQYALLGLYAAVEAGVPVKPEVWTLARSYWEGGQKNNGAWSYKFDDSTPPTTSMTCAGISSLIISGLKRFQGQESLDGAVIKDCGKGGTNINLQRGTDWLARAFTVKQNVGAGQQFRFYYLYGLERAGRLTGQRFFGEHDWYREGAAKLVEEQDQIDGFWRGSPPYEDKPTIATAFSLLFLAKGRAPVLVNKLRHGPKGDWNNDADDVRNIVNAVSRDWKSLLTWQVVDPNISTVEDMLQAPIVFFNGHEAPVFSSEGKKNLRDYVDQGGFIFAEACCGRKEFDDGFRALMEEVFPETEYKLHALKEDHAVWRSHYTLKPEVHPLFGIEHGCRTVVIYSPGDLSCFWNQSETNSSNTEVIKSLRVGQNVVDYATGRELPPDKLTVRDVRDFKPEVSKRGALQIAKLKHAGEWNLAPLAIPNLMTTLRDKLGLDVVISHRDVYPSDPNLVNYPLLYVHGRRAFSLSKTDLQAIREHLEPGGGTLFADAACGSPAFDVAFRKIAEELFPDKKLEPIPRSDDLFSKNGGGFDLSDVQYSKAAGGAKDYPQLEGVKIDGHWAIIYSKYDLGCALERHAGLDCKGYSLESAARIATNIVIYSTLPN